MRGAQKCGLGDAGQGAAALPISQEHLAEDLLPDPLHNQPLGLGCLRKRPGASCKLGKRRHRQAFGKIIDAPQRAVKRRERLEPKAGQARARNLRLRQAERGNHARVVKRPIPRSLRPRTGQVKPPRHGVRGKARPALVQAQTAAKPIVMSGLVAFGQNDEGGRVFDLLRHGSKTEFGEGAALLYPVSGGKREPRGAEFAVLADFLIL